MISENSASYLQIVSFCIEHPTPLEYQVLFRRTLCNLTMDLSVVADGQSYQSKCQKGSLPSTN